MVSTPHDLHRSGKTLESNSCRASGSSVLKVLSRSANDAVRGTVLLQRRQRTPLIFDLETAVARRMWWNSFRTKIVHPCTMPYRRPSCVTVSTVLFGERN